MAAPGRRLNLTEVARLVAEFVPLNKRRQEGALSEVEERRWSELKEQLVTAQREERSKGLP